jgi:hypothetical protein
MYGGYYGGSYGYYDDDWIVGLAVGTTVAAVAVAASDEDDDDTSTTTTTTTTAPPAVLPCDPTVTIANGVTYYQCGPQYYVQAYGGTGPIYMPVPPPAPGMPAPAPATPEPAPPG